MRNVIGKWGVVLSLSCGVACGNELSQQLVEARSRYQTLLRSLTDLESNFQMLSNQMDSLSRDDMVPGVCQGRLTGTSGTPVVTGNNNNVRQLRFTPYLGNKIALYYSGKWKLYTFGEVSLDMNTTSASVAVDSLIDVFAYKATDGSLALEASAQWADDFTRTDALTRQDGIWVKAADPTRRYIGTVRTDSTAANRRIDNNPTNRGIFNVCNRLPIPLRFVDGTNSWTYNASAWRQAGANTANQVSFVTGLKEDVVRITAKGNVISTDNTRRDAAVGIGIDTATANSAFLLGGAASPSSTLAVQLYARYEGYVEPGWHTVYFIESCNGCAGTNATFWGDNGSAARTRSGILVWVNQ